jgi:hypothetical protein
MAFNVKVMQYGFFVLATLMCIKAWPSKNSSNVIPRSSSRSGNGVHEGGSKYI